MFAPSSTLRATGLSRLRSELPPSWSLAVVFVLLMGTASAQVPNERCVSCHSQAEIELLPMTFGDGMKVSPRIDTATFLRSAHAELDCIECHLLCHPEFKGEFGPRTLPPRREYVRQIEKACRNCHTTINGSDGDHTAGHAAYYGDNAPLCVDCHEVHRMKRVSTAIAATPIMEGPQSWGTMFATKGIEYLLVVVYAAVFIPFAILLFRSAQRLAPVQRLEEAIARRGSSWFQLPDGYLVHRGHAWALPEGGNVFKVGMDDFSGRLIGEPTEVALPSMGGSLDQGERGWQVRVNGNTLDVLSPVPGEVVEVNEEVVNSPSTVAEDPYGKGWLMKVRVKRPKAVLANLLSHGLAGAWYDEIEKEIGSLMEGRLGTVLQDGGIPASGFARELAGENWPELAAKFLLTTPSSESSD